MVIDRRLLVYFRNVILFHRTGEEVWLDLLRTHGQQGSGPGPTAARAFVTSIDTSQSNKEKALDSS